MALFPAVIAETPPARTTAPDRERSITIAIPTAGRGAVLVDTLLPLLAQFPSAREILVVQQGSCPEPEAEARLSQWQTENRIRRVLLDRRSIPHAMNTALCEASCPIVLFVDDDIIPMPGLIGSHAAAYGEAEDIWAVAGQVLQPGQEPLPSTRSSPSAASACSAGRSFSSPSRACGLRADLDFPFNSTNPAFVRSVMAGNFSVRRDKALEIGGFDENFVGVAYRFETEFCRRIWKHGGKVLFQPAAGIRHLRATQGGTRTYGDHRRSASPAHGVGDYYFALRHGLSRETIAYMARRPLREVCTRFHLRHPWWIPVKLLGELRAFLLALSLARRGPRYVQSR